MITFGVFFPALMGAGILVSGVLLLSDTVRRLMPNRGQRRRHRIAVGTYGLIAATARTVGVSIDPPSFLTRRPRSRVTYLLVALIGTVAGATALWTGLDAYEDPLGVLFRSPWAIGLGVAALIAFLLVAGVALLLVVLKSSDSVALTWVVEHSPYGHLAIPQRIAVHVDLRKDES